MNTYEIVVQRVDEPSVETKQACFISGGATASIIFLQFVMGRGSEFDLPDLVDRPIDTTDVCSIKSVAISKDGRKQLVLREYH